MRCIGFLSWACNYTIKGASGVVRRCRALKKPPRREAIKIILLYPILCLPIVQPCGGVLRLWGFRG